MGPDPRRGAGRGAMISRGHEDVWFDIGLVIGHCNRGLRSGLRNALPSIKIEIDRNFKTEANRAEVQGSFRQGQQGYLNLLSVYGFL